MEEGQIPWLNLCPRRKQGRSCYWANLERIDHTVTVVSLDAKRLTKDLRSRLEDIPALFGRACVSGSPDAQEAPRRAYPLWSGYGRG